MSIPPPPPPPPSPGPPYPGSQPPYPVVPGYVQAPPNDGGAIAALITGISSLVGAFFCSPIGLILGSVGLILGLMARSRIRASGGQRGGDGMALAGAITGGIGAALSVLAVVVTVLFYGAFAALIASGAIRPSPSP